jgi:hypothetical protein
MAIPLAKKTHFMHEFQTIFFLLIAIIKRSTSKQKCKIWRFESQGRETIHFFLKCVLTIRLFRRTQLYNAKVK